MKALFIIISLLVSFSCAPTIKQPKATWYVDPVKIPWAQYILDKEVCQNYANAIFPIDSNRIRKLGCSPCKNKANLTCYLDCMYKKGYNVYCIIEK